MICKQCNEEKPSSNFYTYTTKKGNTYTRRKCIQCISINDRKRRYNMMSDENLVRCTRCNNLHMKLKTSSVCSRCRKKTGELFFIDEDGNKRYYSSWSNNG